MNNIIDIIKRVFYALMNKFRIENEPTEGSSQVRKYIKNTDILNDFKELFLYNIERDSLGDRMLYPMYFNILMHEEDYKDRKSYFPYIVPEIIKALYAIIKEEQSRYKNITPVCKYWVFQFSPCRNGGQFDAEDGETNMIDRGALIPTALLYNPDLDIVNNVSVKGNIKVSVKCNNSNVIKNANINLDALLGIDMLEEGYFRYKFNDKLVFESEQKVSNAMDNSKEITANKSELAILTYQKAGYNIEYTMKDSPIYISGKNDERKISTVFKLENEELENGHVQIKYENNKFYLCAFGHTRLNEKLVPMSKTGDLQWVDLANNSSILMNSFVSVKFKKLV